MKSDVLRRLEALERALSPVVYPVLTITEVHRQPDAIRERYWNGDMTALDIPSYPDLPPGTIHTIIVDLGAESRDAWEQTRNMTDDEYEAWDEARIREKEQAPSTAVVHTTPEPRFDIWGYRIPG